MKKLFFETICVEKGQAQNLKAHDERMRKTASHFGFTAPKMPELEKQLPANLANETVKCRILYDKRIREVTFHQYFPKEIRSLKLVEASVDYSYKWADRSALTAQLGQKDECDEVLITRNGMITDTSFSNVVFRKRNKLFTPATFLLNGTKRQKLIAGGIIIEHPIHRDSLCEYERVYLINAMLDIDESRSIDIEKIIR